MTTDATQRDAWLTLLLAPGVGPVTGMRLLQAYGSAAAALSAGPSGWTRAGVPEALHAGLRQPDAAAMARCQAWLDAPQRALISLDDPHYPQRLLEIPRPPLALFCLGDVSLLTRDQLAVVGARAASRQGLEHARSFAGEIARAGLCITSGLASGIDGAAHEAALEAGGSTIAVAGTGPDRVYPARHRALAHRIGEHGLLISEFLPGTGAQAQHFPRRNRIIAGLSLGVLVVEAAKRSGSLITARLAAENGREVFAIPGSIHHPQARGCHALIRDGALLVESAKDVLFALGRDEAHAPDTLQNVIKPHASAALSGAAAKTLSAVGDHATAFDLLVARTGLDIQTLSSALLELELAGLVASEPGGNFSRLGRAR
ncbi:DNA-processing protein DprA [Algiphilus sp.]|uniref:DNA-processing protein DprA n=1 Tax=Algiphilus sp. TaxID=1872431 RepID=UPI003BA90DCF